jgi:prefoldin subunit 5
MTVANDIQENLKVLASSITTISTVLNDEKLENAPTRDRAELLVRVAASLRDMAAALRTIAELVETLAQEGGDLS